MVRHYPNPATAAAIHEALADGADLIQVEYVQMAAYVPPQPRPKVVLVAYDVLARRAHRARQVAGAGRHVELGDWRARRHEAAAFRAADVVVVTGEHERPAAVAAGARVVRVIPNGADDRLIQIPAGGGPDKLVFVGWGGHTPNRDALSWWVEAVAPLIREDVVLTVAGDGWDDVAPDPRVRMFGYCSNISSLLTDAIAVLPLRVGGGVKLKTVEAMAAGRPIIATPVAVEGLPVRDGIEALVRDTPQGIASAVGELRGDSELRRRLGEAARQAARPFLWSRVVRQMDELYAEVVDQAPSRTLE